MFTKQEKARIAKVLAEAYPGGSFVMEREFVLITHTSGWVNVREIKIARKKVLILRPGAADTIREYIIKEPFPSAVRRYKFKEKNSTYYAILEGA